MNKTILYSATRQWNPGDEFIFYGVRRIFNEVVGKHNTVLYNRNPYVVRYGRARLETFRDSMYENSWIDGGYIPDAVVMMGPEWYGPGCKSLYEAVLRHNLPLYMLGVGTAKLDLTDTEKEAIGSNVRLIMARDEYAGDCLRGYGSTVDICPAIFAAGYNRLRIFKSKVGLIFHAGLYHSSPDEDLFDRLHIAWKAICAEMDVRMICHTYVDFCDAKTLFPNADIFYSSFAEDYVEAYDGVDVVAGTRIHGMGMAASLGIPGIFVPLPYDDRAPAAKGFNSIFSEPEDVLGNIKKIDIRELSSELIERKKAAWGRYVDRVRVAWEKG